MIRLWPSSVDSNTDFERLGDRILHPISCKITEKSGASYELSMELPMPYNQSHGIGMWSIISAPCPVPQLDSATTGGDVIIWRILYAPVYLYAPPKAPQPISYDAWVGGTDYSVGAKVTYSEQNYQLTQALEGLIEKHQAPPNCSKWSKISNHTGGAARLYTFERYEECYLIDDYSSSWIYVQTIKGLRGYVQKHLAEYVRTEHREPVDPQRSIEQLFRVYQISENQVKRTVSVQARHVSYDLQGNLLDDCDIGGMEAGVAISYIQSAMLMESDCLIATNLDSTDGTFSGNLTGKNAVNALLDPESGIVGHFNAMLVRNNWDFFIYRRVMRESGLILHAGKNITGITWKYDWSNIINRVMPVAKGSDGKPFYLAGSRYVDAPNIQYQSIIYMEKLSVEGQVGKPDPTGTNYTEETLRAKMTTEAQRRFTVDMCATPLVDVTVDFVALGDTTEFALYKGLQELYMYDSVKVQDEVGTYKTTLSVCEYTWDALAQRYEQIKLQTPRQASISRVAGFDMCDRSIGLNKLSDAAKTALGI